MNRWSPVRETTKVSHFLLTLVFSYEKRRGFIRRLGGKRWPPKYLQDKLKSTGNYRGSYSADSKPLESIESGEADTRLEEVLALECFENLTSPVGFDGSTTAWSLANLPLFRAGAMRWCRVAVWNQKTLDMCAVLDSLPSQSNTAHIHFHQFHTTKFTSPGARRDCGAREQAVRRDASLSFGCTCNFKIEMDMPSTWGQGKGEGTTGRKSQPVAEDKRGRGTGTLTLCHQSWL